MTEPVVFLNDRHREGQHDHLADDVVNADEAWLTTTPYCMPPCTKSNQTPIRGGAPGPWFKKMIRAWSERVELDIEGQVMN
jgi:branched-chain amino acid aminotransferase|uniref:hypothetical protein n=1 Tax=Prosthecobacter sp. TaxID=1965333 RepID=UPI00378530FF